MILRVSQTYCTRELQNVTGKRELKQSLCWGKNNWNPCIGDIFKIALGNEYYERIMYDFQKKFWTKIIKLSFNSTIYDLFEVPSYSLFSISLLFSLYFQSFPPPCSFWHSKWYNHPSVTQNRTLGIILNSAFILTSYNQTTMKSCQV